MVIGYQGILGSFSSIAAKNIFPTAEFKNYLSFKDVIDNVLNATLDYGVLPIENSYTGEVGMVLDELFHADVYINQEYELPIIQNLVGIKEAKRSDIKMVYSHEQALMQCSKFLAKNNYELVSFANTALASKFIQEQNDVTKAAIASKMTADLYGLRVIEANINDDSTNTTRFIVISKSLMPNKEHFSFMFTVIDESGALAKVLNEISKASINLLSIKSRPVHDLAWKYYFYCEAEGDLADLRIQSLISILKAKCEIFKIIGSY